MELNERLDLLAGIAEAGATLAGPGRLDPLEAARSCGAVEAFAWTLGWKGRGPVEGALEVDTIATWTERARRILRVEFEAHGELLAPLYARRVFNRLIAP